MNLQTESTRERKQMTEHEKQKAVDALINWRLTEREMIADRENTTKMQAHSVAKRFAREMADTLIKGMP
jgi:hypothetical protein